LPPPPWNCQVPSKQSARPDEVVHCSKGFEHAPSTVHQPWSAQIACIVLESPLVQSMWRRHSSPGVHPFDGKASSSAVQVRSAEEAPPPPMLLAPAPWLPEPPPPPVLESPWEPSPASPLHAAPALIARVTTNGLRYFRFFLCTFELLCKSNTMDFLLRLSISQGILPAKEGEQPVGSCERIVPIDAWHDTTVRVRNVRKMLRPCLTPAEPGRRQPGCCFAGRFSLGPLSF